jgi:nitrate/nitrite transporter NarK
LCLSLMAVRSHWDDDRNPDAPLSGSVFASVQMIWRSPPLRALSLAGFCFGAVQLSLMTFAVTMLVRDVGFSLIEAGATLSLIQAAGVLGRLFWGWLADRLQNALLVLIFITVISLAACLGVVGLGPAWPRPAIYAVLAIFGLSAVGWNGVFMAEVARASMGHDVGSATGGASAITFFGVMFGPGLFTTAYAFIGSYAQTFAIPACLTVVGLMLVILADRSTRAAALSHRPAPG